MDPGTVLCAADGDVDRLFRVAADDLVIAILYGDDLPLLAFGANIVPQLNNAAVFKVEIGDFKHMAGCLCGNGVIAVWNKLKLCHDTTLLCSSYYQL
ncbi:hypothetical protein SDC9_210077 [bioreactor metagenome]|uniref:Uncharacterized protein n=1 Tax=bioreactor metagenome TaxID=1076179 RepID=A0A645JGT8_9ZZZZ